MFCSKCGHQVSDDARFCADCGAPVKQQVVASRESASAYARGTMRYSSERNNRTERGGVKRPIPKFALFAGVVFVVVAIVAIVLFAPHYTGSRGLVAGVYEGSIPGGMGVTVSIDQEGDSSISATFIDENQLKYYESIAKEDGRPVSDFYVGTTIAGSYEEVRESNGSILYNLIPATFADKYNSYSIKADGTVYEDGKQLSGYTLSLMAMVPHGYGDGNLEGRWGFLSEEKYSSGGREIKGGLVTLDGTNKGELYVIGSYSEYQGTLTEILEADLSTDALITGGDAGTEFEALYHDGLELYRYEIESWREASPGTYELSIARFSSQGSGTVTVSFPNS